MLQTITLSMFRDAFHPYRKDNFTYAGLELLYDYLEEVSPDYDLDVVELCCDFVEAMPSDVAKDYDIDISDCDEDDDQAIRDVVLAHLDDSTSVLGVTSIGSIVYAQF